jgi:hypothetical protein
MGAAVDGSSRPPPTAAAYRADACLSGVAPICCATCFSFSACISIWGKISAANRFSSGF